MAGIASAQIAPNGDVWTCCIRAESMGNLREHDYDFAKVWRTAKAQQLRRSIKAGECYCPLANASYTNMLTHGRTLLKVAAEVARARRPSLPSAHTSHPEMPSAHTSHPEMPSAPATPRDTAAGLAQNAGEHVDAAAR
jgi:hypothetical protein